MQAGGRLRGGVVENYQLLACPLLEKEPTTQIFLMNTTESHNYIPGMTPDVAPEGLGHTGHHENPTHENAESTTQRIRREAEEKAREKAHEASEHGRKLLSANQERAADFLSDCGEALQAGRTRLKEKQGENAATASVDVASDYLNHAADYMRHDPGKIAEDARGFIRERPSLALGMLALSGFLIARGLKASERTQTSQY